MSTFEPQFSIGILTLFAACLLLPGRSGAEEPPAREQPVTQSRLMQIPPVATLPMPCTCGRRSRYEVWQYYGVDRSGYFRLRVNYSSVGSYYLVDGRAFPWVTTHELEVMPWVVD